MPSSNESQIHRLSVATAYCLFDRQFRSMGKWSIMWGLFCVAVGVWGAWRGFWINLDLLLGLALVGEGIYQLRSRDPKVLRVSALTLGALAVWNLGAVALALIAKTTVAFAGQSIWAGIVEGVGAYDLWHSYAAYVAVKKEVDEAAVEEVRRELLDIFKTETLQWKTKDGWFEEIDWFLKLHGPLVFLVGYESGLAGPKDTIKSWGWTEPRLIQVQQEGETWSGKQVKATITIGDQQIKHALLSPEVFRQLQGLSLGILPPGAASKLGAGG